MRHVTSEIVRLDSQPAIPSIHTCFSCFFLARVTRTELGFYPKLDHLSLEAELAREQKIFVGKGSREINGGFEPDSMAQLELHRKCSRNPDRPSAITKAVRNRKNYDIYVGKTSLSAPSYDRA